MFNGGYHVEVNVGVSFALLGLQLCQITIHTIPSSVVPGAPWNQDGGPLLPMVAGAPRAGMARGLPERSICVMECVCVFMDGRIFGGMGLFAEKE